MTQDRVVEGPQIERVAKAGSRLIPESLDLVLPNFVGERLGRQANVPIRLDGRVRRR